MGRTDHRSDDGADERLLAESVAAPEMIGTQNEAVVEWYRAEAARLADCLRTVINAHFDECVECRRGLAALDHYYPATYSDRLKASARIDGLPPSPESVKKDSI